MIVGDALLMAGRGEDLIGFSKPVCQTIAEFWDLDMEDALIQRLGQYEDTGYAPEEIKALEDLKNGLDDRFQTFSPD